MLENKVSKWKAIGQSVQGASHLRSRLPNQDAIKFEFTGGHDEFGVLAVADGHGSPKCFRSDQGSRLAVETAVRVTLAFLQAQEADPSRNAELLAREQLPDQIVREWLQLVQKDLASKPFTPIELDRIEKELGPGSKEKLVEPDRSLMAYGSTLLLAGISSEFVFYLQLGDGDILEVVNHQDGVEHPLPDDPSMIANETTSLCMKNAQSMFRFAFRRLRDLSPILILVSTDGYSNSFSTPADFKKVGPDLLKIIKDEGLNSVNNCLADWLNEASRSGSGDDVTLGILCRVDKQSSAPSAADLTPEESTALTSEGKSNTLDLTKQGAST